MFNITHCNSCPKTYRFAARNKIPPNHISCTSHVWPDENPRATRPQGFRLRHSSGFLDVVSGLLGLNILHLNLMNGAHLIFLKHVLHGLLEVVPLRFRQNMWFQQDGSPPHFSFAVRGHMDQRFGQKWIGRSDPIAWPACHGRQT